MLKWRGLLCISALLSLSGNTFAQSPNDFLRLFGGIIQESMVQQAQKEWRALPPTEISCLDQSLLRQGSSVAILINHGVLPSDPRLTQLRSGCRLQMAQPPQSPTDGQSSNPAQTSPYVVDGLRLGTRFQPDNPAYQRYRCGPSDKFPRFTWCHEEHATRQNGHEITHSHSILEDQRGTAWYVNSYLEPAFFSPSDMQNELNRLSKKFGEKPREFHLTHRDGLSDAVIAVWGNVQLQPLDGADVSTVASGGTVKGLLISYLGDLERSAKAGVPVYRLEGGAGFVWAATYNQNGRGALRFLAVDASKTGTTPQIVQQQPANQPLSQAKPSAPPNPLATAQLPNTTQGSVAGSPRGWIGVQIQNVAGDAAKTVGPNVTAGALVVAPVAGGPAAKAGLLSGDVITAVNGNPVKDAHDLASAIGQMSPHSMATLTIIRTGDEKTLAVTVGTDFAEGVCFSDIENLVAIPRACTLARRLGPSQMYVRDPFTGRNTPGPFCESANECLDTLTRRVPALVNYLRQHPQLMKQLNLPPQVYAALGQAGRLVAFQPNVNCNYGITNNTLFSLNLSLDSQSAFERLSVAVENFLNNIQSNYNNDLNNYTAWLPFARHYDHSAELAEVEAKYKAAYQTSDMDGFLRLAPDFEDQLSQAEAFQDKLVQQSDQLALLDSQFIDLSRQVEDAKLASVLDPKIAKVVEAQKAKISQLRTIVPAARGDVSDEIADIERKKDQIDKQIELAQTTDEARHHGFRSAEEYENCLTEQQKLQASGIQKSCDR